MKLLEIKNLSYKVNGVKLLDNISISLDKGSIYAFVGPNGVGKTTLGHTIMGLEGYRDFEGDIVFKGKSIKELDVYERATRGITLAWQEPARFEGISIEKFISSSGKNVSHDEVTEILKDVGMESETYCKRAVDKSLSGGERKKVELASILAMKPELGILDELDSGIDMDTLDNIFKAIHFLKSGGSTIILITHSKAVLRQAEYAFLMCHGRILKEGKTSTISRYFTRKCLPCDHKNVPDE